MTRRESSLHDARAPCTERRQSSSLARVEFTVPGELVVDRPARRPSGSLYGLEDRLDLLQEVGVYGSEFGSTDHGIDVAS